MKIALVVKTFLPQGGGSERYVWNLARGLLLAGHELHVYAAEWSAEAPGAITFHALRRISAPSFLAVHSLCRSAERILSVERELYDVVVGFGKTVGQDVYRAGGGCHRAWLRHKWGKPRPLWERVHPLHREILRIEDRIYGDPQGAHIICNSKLIERELGDYYPATRGRTTVVYNGVDGELFHPRRRSEAHTRVRTALGIDASQRMLLFVGHDAHRKGLDLILEAWQRLPAGPQDRLRLVVAGKAAASLSMRGGGVLPIGTSSDMPSLYAASDLLCFPTRYDAFSNVVLEAMSSGIPVITTDSNGACEIVEEARNGWVVPLAQAVEHLTELLAGLPEADLAAMGAAARATAERFTLERNVAESLRVYERCARRRPDSA